MPDWKMVWLWSDRLTILISLAAAVFAGLGWGKAMLLYRANRRAEARRRAQITIKLNCGDQSLELPHRPRRDQLSRQELTGLLSFYHGVDRFDPAVVRQVLEDGSLNRVLAGDDPSRADELLSLNVDEGFFQRVHSTISDGQPGE